MNTVRAGCVTALLLSLFAQPLFAQQIPGGLTGSPVATAIVQRPEQTKAELTRTLETARKEKDPHGEAIALLMLGLTELALNNPDGSRVNLEESAKKMEAQNDVIGQWMATLVLAQLEQALGNTQQALTSMEKTLDILSAGKASTAPFTLKTMIALASGEGSGLPPGALEMMKDSADLMKTMILQYCLEPVTHDLYGSMLTEAGQFEKAEEALNAAAAGSQYFQGLYDFSIAAHFGDLRYKQGRYDEARTQYQKALSGSLQTPMNPLGDQWIRLSIYDRLARLEASTGHLDDAMGWNDKSLEILRTSGMPVQECVTLETRGQLLMRAERLAEAETAFQSAMKIAHNAKSTARMAEIESHLGNLQIMKGDYGAAASHLERSVQHFQSLKNPISEAATWGTLSHAYSLTDNMAAAEDALARARKLVENGRFPLGEDMIAISETWIRFRKGQATPADVKASVDQLMKNPSIHHNEIGKDVELLLQHSMKVRETGKFSNAPPKKQSSLPLFDRYWLMVGALEKLEEGDVEAARTIWLNARKGNSSTDMDVALLASIGASYWREGNFEQASHWFSEAATALDKLGDKIQSEAMLTSLLGSYHRVYYEVTVESLLRSGKIKEAFEVTERARARAFLRMISSDRLKPPEGAGSALAEEARQIQKTIADWDRTPQPGKSLADLRQRHETLQVRLQAVAPEYASLTSVPALQLGDIQKEIPDNTTLISYFVTIFGVHVWVVDKESVEHVRLNVSTPQFRRITCWAFQLARPRSGTAIGDDGCEGDPADANEAYTALVAPLRSKIRNSRLMILPHAELHYVPFAALHDAARGKYLVEEYPISYIPSASTLRFLRKKESDLQGGALVLGDPVAPTQGRLPGAQTEAETVAKKVHATPKLGDAAQEDLLYEAKDSIDLLHIAAHATYDPTNPLFSAIHLAKSRNRDGQLSVDEIQSEIDLKGVNLVVLSACRSGVGNRSGGDEIVGLTRAILYAGSPGVISTLWNISDEATPPLIEKFYDHLLAGLPAADALQKAQTELLQSAKYKDPKFWAAFSLTGNPTANWKGFNAAPGSRRQ